MYLFVRVSDTAAPLPDNKRQGTRQQARAAGKRCMMGLSEHPMIDVTGL